MKLIFLSLPQNERNAYLNEAAARRHVDPVLVEKDFWVSWILGVLFQHSELKSSLVFKGGTSLSKVFGAIRRFSEDIDLAVSPTFVGISEEEIESAGSRNKRDKLMKHLEAACSDAVSKLAPGLEKILADHLGKRHGKGNWLEFAQDGMTQSPVLYFHYPSTGNVGMEYLPRTVKLEFGSLTDQVPVGKHPVKPWVAEEFPDAFPDWQCEVVALEADRTFWEKATILHAEYHRPSGDSMPERFSRHYADMAELANHALAKQALREDGLRQRVVDWKSRFFARTWAHYELAVPGTFHLVPPQERLQALRMDYQAMREMFIVEPKSFDEVIGTLAALERRLNTLTDSSIQ